MTDREKVIVEIEDALSGNLAKAGHVYKLSLNGLKDKALTDAVALLKEQEPKRVVITTNSYGTKFYHCPRCNHDLYAYPRQIYCSQCGQEMKWDG